MDLRGTGKVPEYSRDLTYQDAVIYGSPQLETYSISEFAQEATATA